MSSRIKKFNVGSLDFTFVCRSRYTRSGFAHDVEMFYEEDVEAEATRHYLNRTWESYAFQSTMLDCVDKVIDAEVEKITTRIKEEKGWSKLTPSRREYIEDYCNYDGTICNYRELREMVKRG